jgi:lipoprotein NlpD
MDTSVQFRFGGAGMSALRAWILACLCAGLLVGCNSSSQKPVVVDRSAGSGYTKKTQPAGGKYIVQRGDTLYSIAFRFGWDWKTLAARNNIAAPYVIMPKQVIHFSASPSPVQAYVPPVTKTQTAYTPPVTRAVTPPAQPMTSTTITAPVAAPVVAPTATAPSVASTAAPVITPVKLSSSGWAWPAQGIVIGKFSSNGSLNKGIDIAGELGQPVLAGQDGTVVYAGSGLRGYGELVIIKHSDVYVSAYGHNRNLLVREGQKVKAGQVIANMGSTGTDRVKLHFEIRRKGKPVDPLQYLPSR